MAPPTGTATALGKMKEEKEAAIKEVEQLKVSSHLIGIRFSRENETDVSQVKVEELEKQIAEGRAEQEEKLEALRKELAEVQARSVLL